MSTSRTPHASSPAPSAGARHAADKVAALRFSLGLAEGLCAEALIRCDGDTAKAEALLRATARGQARRRVTADA